MRGQLQRLHPDERGHGAACGRFGLLGFTVTKSGGEHLLMKALK